MLQTAGRGRQQVGEGINKVLPRSGGTYGDGLTSEAVGSILEITKPGEVVLNPEQQMNMAKGMMDMGAEKAFSGLTDVLPKQSAAPAMSFDLSKISQDINTSVSGGGGGEDQTSAALDFASKRRQELEDLMNDGQARNSLEWDEIFDEAEQLDGQIERLTNKQLESISKYADGWDETGDIMDRVSADILDAIPLDEFGEFAGVDEAVAKQGAMADMVSATSPTAGGIDIGNISFGPNGMPIMGQTKAAAATIPAKPSEKTAEEQAKDREARAKAEMGTDTSAKEKKTGSDKAPAAAGGKEASMSDMLTSLNQLNTKMAQLITVTETGHKDVAKATKSNNPNLFKA